MLSYVMQHLPAFWGADADTFRPERFLKTASGADAISSAAASFSFMPFLAGPRSCIGSRFAVLEMKVL